MINILKVLIGKESQYPLKHRILNIVIFLGIGACLSGSISDYLLGLGNWLRVVTVSSSIIFIFSYYLSVKKRQYINTVHLVFFTVLAIIIPGVWIFNGGTLGGCPYYIITIFSSITILFIGRRKYIYLLALIIIVSILIVLEYNDPLLITGYETKFDRFVDIYFSLIFNMISSAALIVTILNQYKREYKKTREYSEQIEKQKLEIELQKNLKVINEQLQQEIAAHKITEANLRSSERRFSKAFNASPVPMCIFTLEYRRFIDVNESFVKLFEYQRQDIIGQHSSNLNVFYESLETAKENEVVRNLEVRFSTKSNRECIGLLSTEVITLNGEQCLLGVLNDVTERHQMEKEIARLARLHLVGEMATGLGHEIRNPMTTVRGFLQLLQKSDPKNQGYFDIMIEELDNANSIITEYLFLAKNKRLDLRKGNLNQIIQELYSSKQKESLDMDKNIHINTGEISDLFLDEREVRHLIRNLVDNGLEAMPSGGKVTITTFTEGEEVLLSVQDEGKGIEPDVLEKMGTPFFTTKENGTGLGLAVCYSIASRHNASVQIETGPKGTKIVVRFYKGKNH